MVMHANFLPKKWVYYVLKVQVFETSCLRKLLHFSTWSTKPTTGCGARSTSLWVHRNLFLQLSGDGNLHVLGMLHAMTTSPRPSIRAPWRLGNAMVGRGNAGWTTPNSGHPCPCQNCSQWPPAEETGRGSLLNHLSRPIPDSPIGQGTEQNWTSKKKKKREKKREKHIRRNNAERFYRWLFVTWSWLSAHLNRPLLCPPLGEKCWQLCHTLRTL